MAAIARGEVTDEVLMLRFQAGDRTCFAALLRRHKTPTYNFILRMVRSGPAAEDLVQDVFVRVVQNAGDFKHDARFCTWLYTIARNVCIDHLRKFSLRKHASLDHPGSMASGGSLHERTGDNHPRAATERSVIGVELAQRIVQSVERLPDEQREVFLLRQLADLTVKEISAVSGVPENTVKSRMHYALVRLQQDLADYEDYARALR